MGAGGSVDPSGQARVNVREVLNAIFYVLWTGCQWKALPKDLPPRSTVWEYLDLWDSDGTLERIHHALYVEMRENAGREASPTTAWPQAPRSDGYNWPVAGRSRPPRQRTGPRRRRGSAPRGPTELPVHRAHHRRRRLSRAKDASRRRPHRQLGASDRAPLRPAPVRLRRRLHDVSTRAQRQLDEHLHHLSYERGQKWLAVGLSLVRDDKCPFCAQGLVGNELVAAYRACFSAAYEDLAKEVGDQQIAIAEALGSGAVFQIEAVLSRNMEAMSFWSRYCDLDLVPRIDFLALKQAIERARQTATTLLERKSANLLAPLEKDGEAVAAETALARTAEALRSYNEAVGAANLRIADRRRALERVALVGAQSAIINLKRRKARFDEPVLTTCAQYASLDTQRQDLTSRKTAAKDALDAYTASVVREYEDTLNKHLRGFLVGFRIKGTKAEYPSRIPSSSYQLVINDVPVDLGGENTTTAEPSFRNTLSGGDRSALAL